MDIWLKFEVSYQESTKRLEIVLREFFKESAKDKDALSTTNPFGRVVGVKSIKIPDRFFKRPVKIADLVSKSKVDMLAEYYRYRDMKEHLLTACLEWSKEKITVQDGQLADIINDLNKI